MTLTHTLSGNNLIDGQWSGTNPKTFQSTNPKTAQPLDPAFHIATDAEIDKAFAAAQRAFEVSRGLPRERTAALLERIADRIMDLGDALLQAGERETALPPARLVGERARTTGQLRLFAALVKDGAWVDAVIDTADPKRQPAPKPDVRRMLRPLGPVVVFDASNFPFAFGVCGGDTASALAAGNPVLVKGHTGHPATNELFAAAVLAALRDLDLPPGMLALLQGPGSSVGAAMVKHPAAEAVGFTGSRTGGRALFDLAAARPRPIAVYAEMGSINPLVILPAALAQKSDALAEGLAGSVTLGAGQFCTKPGLVFLLEGPHTEAFAVKLATRLAAAPGFTMLSPDIQKGFAHATQRLKGHAGLRVRVAGTCTAPAGSAGCTASLFEVDARTWRESPGLQEEAFGPATMLVRCRDQAELLAALALAPGQLTGTVHVGDAEDPALVSAVADVLERGVGRLIFNGYPTGVEVCHAMVHGGPYPATTAPGTTSVGTLAIRRFVRPVAYQNLPDALLPPALRNANPLGIPRLVNGKTSAEAIA